MLFLLPRLLLLLLLLLPLLRLQCPCSTPVPTSGASHRSDPHSTHLARYGTGLASRTHQDVGAVFLLDV